MAADRTVLVADDEPAVRAVLTQLLDMLGFEVVAQASNGDDALDLFERLKPSNVLIDLRMPGVDGIEATRRMCIADSPHVVVMSAYPDEALQDAARAAGASAYVVKGGRIEELVDALKRR